MRNCVVEYCTGVIDEGSDWERHTNQTALLGLQKEGRALARASTWSG